MNEFFTLYQGLDREGPGEAADVAWAIQVANVARDAAICDAGSGSGGDIAALLAGAPEGHVTAVEIHAGFVDEARARVGDDPRVTHVLGDMAQISGPYDMIWSAGAAYFLGVREALELWRPALTHRGVIAFSHIVWWVDAPGARARDFWRREYPAMTNRDGILAAIDAAGYELLADRPVSDAGWNAFYTPLESRIRALRPQAGPALTAVLDEAASEIELWRDHRAQYGYLLCVVRPA